MRGKDGEQGAALMIAMTLVLTAGLSLAMDALLIYGKRVRTDKRATTALATAKKSLIAYAAIQGGGVPGLPCAFVGALQNYADFAAYRLNSAGSGCSSDSSNANIGFLPWQAMQLPALRDGNNTPIWYAVSASCGLTINNTGNYAVVLFAPGKALSGQTRNSTDDPAPQADFLDYDYPNHPEHLLHSDRCNAVTSNNFTLSGVMSDTFNDRVLGIACSDIPRG